MSIEERIEKLQEQINQTSGTSSNKKIPLPLVVALIVPIVIFFALFFIQPGFVKKKQGSKYVRCGKKLFQWTLIFTVLIWVGLYLYMYCAYGSEL